MPHKLQVKAFFFNAKTDYLPYYKNFSLSLADDATAKDILIGIQAQNENFSYPEVNLIFKINHLIVEEDTPLTSIINKLGVTLQIDPVNRYRANNGLIINNDDFMQKYELLAPYGDKSDKEYYKTLYALHYASETEQFERDYIGDAILVLAHKMINNGNEHKNEILNAITSVSSGLFDCEYENNLFNVEDHTASINALKEMVKHNNNNNNSLSLIKRIKMAIGIQNNTPILKEKRKDKSKTIQDLKGKQVAYYPGKSYSTVVLEQIKANNISMVTFDRMHKLSGISILADNRTLALKKAGTILLEAYDAGAEILIIEDNSTYTMMQNNFTAIEDTIGRKMIGFELITSENFISQLNYS